MTKNKEIITLVLLSILALLLRWFPVRNGLFTFEYDMAKDSLIMLEIFQYHDPSLVGATTSIPGLFNGPIWYYLALIPNIIFHFNPIGSVVAVWVLVLLNIYLLKKYTNNFTVFMYAVSAGLIGAQQNAWIPYLTTHIMVPILLLLLNLKSNKQINNLQIFLLGFLSALFFHSQAAFGIVFMIIIPVILYFKKIKLSIKTTLIGLGGFFLSLSPLIIFELKNSFIQSKAVISFILDFRTQSKIIEPNSNGFKRIIEIASEMLTVAGQSIFPIELGYFGGFVALIIFVLYLKKKENYQRILVLAPLILGTFFLYLILPAKAYYLVALYPVWIYLFGDYIFIYQKKYIFPIVFLFLVLAFVQLMNSRNNYQLLSDSSTSLYSSKLAAVDKAYELAEGKPFRSYQFVPAVYDYTYQYIYLQKNFEGKYLPTEFSYAPGETTYNTYKHLPPKSSESEIVILIVEDYIYDNVYNDWWNRVTPNLTILEEVSISSSIKVIKAKDENFK